MQRANTDTLISKNSNSASLSPRRRRLRWTAGLLALTIVAGLLVATTVYLAQRPQQYSPDEEVSEITSNLARGIPEDAPAFVFTDVTLAAGLDSFKTFSGLRTSQLPEDMGTGAAWGDYDNDGDDDLFLVSAGGPLNSPQDELVPCELYENLGDGMFRKSSEFPETRIHGMAAAWGDYDSDGFLDLALSGYNELTLFHNEDGPGGRQFVKNSLLQDSNGFWAGLAWGDFDNDHDLDLYVCGYVRYSESEGGSQSTSVQAGTLVPYSLNPASYEPEVNRLYENVGGSEFREIADELQVANRDGRSLQALWHDFDDDGWIDLYVANDISDNVLYRNVEGRFEDLSHAAWVADYRSAMGLAAGDWDRDGDDDLFITHWVAQENALYDNLFADFNRDSDDRVQVSLTNRVTRSSPSKETIYGLRFMDAADRRGLGQVALQSVGWGAEFGDIDNDGWLDLAVANGSTLQTQDVPKRLKAQEPFLFWNKRGEHFYNLAEQSGSLSQQHVSRGLALSDYDNDGDIDILLVHLGEGVQLLRNDTDVANWLEVRLRSQNPNGSQFGFGDGAKVIAFVNGTPLRRTVSSASYLSQSSRILHFGLGVARMVDRLEVRWLGGQTNFFENLAANTRWEITENEPKPKSLFGLPKVARYPVRKTLERAPSSVENRERLVSFWNAQRAAMRALKTEEDLPKAIRLFGEALRLNPDHEDSRYYLSQCLAKSNDIPGALAQLVELIRINPKSRRAFQQVGALKAIHAETDEDLVSAEAYLEEAQSINPEETGVLLMLGEVALMRGNYVKASKLLSYACISNPRSINGFFLRAYLSWKQDDFSTASEHLKEARNALGAELQPLGTTAEGDVKSKQHSERTPLSEFWEQWNGELDLFRAFSGLDEFLTSK